MIIIKSQFKERKVLSTSCSVLCNTYVFAFDFGLWSAHWGAFFLLFFFRIRTFYCTRENITQKVTLQLFLLQQSLHLFYLQQDKVCLNVQTFQRYF